MADSCEHTTEPSGSKNDKLLHLLASHGFCSMELVNVNTMKLKKNVSYGYSKFSSYQ
jgi:hypothetical protein